MSLVDETISVVLRGIPVQRASLSAWMAATMNGIREAGYRLLWPVTLSWSACNGSVTPQFSGCGPVFFFDVVHDDIDGARVAFQCFAGRFRDGFGQFPFLFYRTAFKKLYVDGWQ